MPIVLENREDRTIWNTYAAKLRNLSAHSYRNKYWKENRMDEWHAEYKMIEQERNKILHDIQNPVYSINISLNNEVNNYFDDSSIEKSKLNI